MVPYPHRLNVVLSTPIRRAGAFAQCPTVLAESQSAGRNGQRGPSVTRPPPRKARKQGRNGYNIAATGVRMETSCATRLAPGKQNDCRLIADGLRPAPAVHPMLQTLERHASCAFRVASATLLSRCEVTMDRNSERKWIKIPPSSENRRELVRVGGIQYGFNPKQGAGAGGAGPRWPKAKKKNVPPLSVNRGCRDCYIDGT